MADLLIRDVPAELVAALDAKAVSLGLSSRVLAAHNLA